MSESESYVHPDQWMIKPYSFYKDEYFECRNWRSRFNQYFIFGHFLDCSANYNDKQNSQLWESKKDLKALEELISNEKKRRIERLKSHFENDTWEKRTQPPDSWNSPLPDWMVEKQKSSYLSLKYEEAKKAEGGLDAVEIESFCKLM